MRESSRTCARGSTIRIQIATTAKGLRTLGNWSIWRALTPCHNGLVCRSSRDRRRRKHTSIDHALKYRTYVSSFEETSAFIDCEERRFVTSCRCYTSPKAFCPSLVMCRVANQTSWYSRIIARLLHASVWVYIRSRFLYLVSLLACSGPQQPRGGFFFFALSVLLKFQQFYCHKDSKKSKVRKPTPTMDCASEEI